MFAFQMIASNLLLCAAKVNVIANPFTKTVLKFYLTTLFKKYTKNLTT